MRASMPAIARAFAEAGAELAKIQQDLAAAEEEWLRLELLREEVQGA